MKPPTFAILGAGISGLTLAWKLAEAGCQVTVFEKENQVGGLASTISNEHGFIDVGPHTFFTEDRELLSNFETLMGEDILTCTRSVTLSFRNGLVRYPFQPQDLLKSMGIFNAIHILISYLKQRLTLRSSRDTLTENSSLEPWLIRQFGRALYDSFFKPYTEQFWQISANELSIDAIPNHTRLSFANALSSLWRKKSEKNPSLIDREKLPTYYPRNGFGQIAERISTKATSLGATLLLNSHILQIHPLSDHTFTLDCKQNQIQQAKHFDILISTIPISSLADLLNHPNHELIRSSAGGLHYRPLLVLALVCSKQDLLQGQQYRYFLNRPYHRIFEMPKFSPASVKSGQNLIGIELPVRNLSGNWLRNAAELLKPCLPSLNHDLELEPTQIADCFLIKASHAYPVYRQNYQSDLKKTMRYLSQIPNLYSLGRSAEFRYMDSDQCMRRAINLARHLTNQEINR